MTTEITSEYKNKIIIYINLFVLIVVFCMGGFNAMAGSLSVESGGGGNERITMRLSDKGMAKVFTLNNPDRLVIDIPHQNDIRWLALPYGYSGTYIRSVRTGAFDNKTTRVVFDLHTLPGDVAVKTRSEEGTIIAVELGAYARDAKLTQPSEPEVVKKPRVPDVPLVVIDAGHGGKDPGAIGPGGTKEKVITINYARALADALLATGRYRVYLTRDSDQFIFLRDRVKRARDAKGSIFISLHADAAGSRNVRGLSVYTLSETASDKEAAALAARENSADFLSEIDMPTNDEQVADILVSLAQRDTKERSEELADALVQAIGKKGVRLLSNTHRFAGFAVLKAPDIPSVLVEIGFLSNRTEEKNLQSEAYRKKVLAGILAGLDNYMEKRRNKAR